MVINYDIQKINRMLLDFYNATGINMDLLDKNFSFVGNHSFWEKKKYCKAIQNTEEGRQSCLYSDLCLAEKSQNSKKTEMHICHAGLVDISVPLLYNESIIGYIIFGQIKTDTDFSRIRDYVTSLGLDSHEMESFYSEIPTYDEEQIISISNLAEIIAKYILIENMLKPDLDENLQRALLYINKNIDATLTVESISKNINVSKSTLYRSFHSHFNCTVNAYVNKKRIEKATSLLTNTNLSIEEIALQTGFAGGSYFSKCFKKEKGVSPLKYKKKIS